MFFSRPLVRSLFLYIIIAILLALIGRMHPNQAYAEEYEDEPAAQAAPPPAQAAQPVASALPLPIGSLAGVDLSTGLPSSIPGAATLPPLEAPSEYVRTCVLVFTCVSDSFPMHILQGKLCKTVTLLLRLKHCEKRPSE